MKRILIWMTSLHIGGAERALIGLLQALDYKRVQVDLFLNRHEGELLGDLPPEVRLLPESPRYAAVAEPLARTLARGQVDLACARLLAKAASIAHPGRRGAASFVSLTYSGRFLVPLMPPVEPETVYDLAVSFMTPHHFVAEKVQARVKAAWIHTDYEKYALDLAVERRMWRPYDIIAAVSERTGSSFAHVFPELRDKVRIVDNILPAAQIRRMADEPISDFPNPGRVRLPGSLGESAAASLQGGDDCSQEKDSVNGTLFLLSVGRIVYAKNFESIPEILSSVRKAGVDAHWILIGSGPLESAVRENARRWDVEPYLFLLGQKENPYPYMRRCSVLIQPSRFEGKSVVLREARLLGIPVVLSDYPTAPDNVEDGVDGLILPGDPKMFAEGLVRLLSSPQRLATMSDVLRNRDFAGTEAVREIYKMMERPSHETGVESKEAEL